MSYVTRKIKKASERARRRAQARWAKDRLRRDFLAASDSVKFSGKIVRRIVVIDREAAAREICFYDFDTFADRRRKLREVRAFAGL